MLPNPEPVAAQMDGDLLGKRGGGFDCPHHLSLDVREL
jgi:hypothetical protein